MENCLRILRNGNSICSEIRKYPIFAVIGIGIGIQIVIGIVIVIGIGIILFPSVRSPTAIPTTTTPTTTTTTTPTTTATTTPTTTTTTKPTTTTPCPSGSEGCETFQQVILPRGITDHKTSYSDFQEIESFISSSAPGDPLICSDFYKYVCERWEKSQKEKRAKGNGTISLLDEMKIKNTRNILEEDYIKRKTTATSESGLKELYNDCVQPSSKGAWNPDNICDRNTSKFIQNVELELAEETEKKLKHAGEIVDSIRNTFVKVVKTLQWLTNNTRDEILGKMKVNPFVGFPLKTNTSLPKGEKYWDALLEPFVKYTDDGQTLKISYGALQKPLFHPSYPYIKNIGRLGFYVAHELATLVTKFVYANADPNNTANAEYNNTEYKPFKSRLDCLINQYRETFKIPENVAVTTKDKDFADVLAVNVLYESLKNNLGEDNINKTGEGYWTPIQELLIYIAQSQCAVEYSWENTGDYSRNKFRVRGEMTNNKFFVDAFNCEENRETCNLK